jgi:hypothetical protein
MATKKQQLTRNEILNARRELTRMGIVRDSGKREDGKILWEVAPQYRGEEGIQRLKATLDFDRDQVCMIQ